MREGALARISLAGYITIVCLILALVNLISYRHFTKFDLTEEKAHTLSAQTVKILEALDDTVNIYAFVRPDRSRDVKSFMEKYTFHSDKLEYQIVDPDKSPSLARKYNVTAYDTFLVETAQGRREMTQELTEVKITETLLKALTEKQKKIYILAGHAERSVDETRPMGWSGAKQALLSEMFLVEKLNWFESGKIPDDADMLLIPGPRDDLKEQEISMLAGYLQEGGKLMITLDPGKLPRLEALVKDYGLEFSDDMILDPVSQNLGFDPLVATITAYDKAHPVGAEISMVSFMTVARSIKLAKENTANTETSPIGTTSAQSWGETDIDSIQNSNPEFDEKADNPGPLVVAASAEWDAGPGRGERKIGQEAGKGRLVAVGDSDFASNASLALSANKDLFLNMASWLTESKSQVSIRAKKPEFNPLILPREDLAFIFWCCVVAFPLISVIMGTVVIFQRKRS